MEMAHLETRREPGLQADLHGRALPACAGPGQLQARPDPPSGASGNMQGLTAACLLTCAYRFTLPPSTFSV